MLRNLAIAVLIGLVLGAVLSRYFVNSYAAGIVIGAAAGVSAVLLITVIDRRPSV